MNGILMLVHLHASFLITRPINLLNRLEKGDESHTSRSSWNKPLTHTGATWCYSCPLALQYVSSKEKTKDAKVFRKNQEIWGYPETKKNMLALLEGTLLSEVCIYIYHTYIYIYHTYIYICNIYIYNDQHMDVSLNGGTPRDIIHLGIFHYKTIRTGIPSWPSSASTRQVAWIRPDPSRASEAA